jgi:hypothetical protein
MSEIASFLKPTVPAAVSVGCDMLVPDDVTEAQLIGSLTRTFAKDDQLAAVAVHSRAASGFVLRDEFLEVLVPTLRSAGDVGDADQLFLPGTEDLDPVELRCPVDGQRFQVFFLDPGAGRTCPKHPQIRLELVAAE